jgi:hypothetical protein
VLVRVRAASVCSEEPFSNSAIFFRRADDHVCPRRLRQHAGAGD